MCNRVYGPLTVGLFGCFIAASANWYLASRETCDVDSLKIAAVGIIGCLVTTILQVIVACASVNRLEKTFVFACSKVSLVASCLFACSEVFLYGCAVKKIATDYDPFEQAVKLQKLAIYVLVSSMVVSICVRLFNPCNMKNERPLEEREPEMV